jgi:threonine dehydrogenase-like Zn-dependent dehydrogenase
MVGHEFCGEIIEVGKRWKESFKEGQRFSIQPALNYKGSLYAPGYSYPYIGGAATYIVIPKEVMEMGCLLDYQGDAFFYGSLAEPMSCIVGAFHAAYHTRTGKYIHDMDIKEGGAMAILAGVGPMGLGAIDYAIHRERKPSVLTVTDIDQTRLDRAASIYTVEEAAEQGVTLRYVNTKELDNPEETLISYTDGKGYDDVFVFAPVKPVVEQGNRILGRDGCLNFFAGPTDPSFSANFNFYNVHYLSHHIVGTSGGNTEDMVESLTMMANSTINPSAMITHIGGLGSVVDTVLDLPNIPGGKKLIYTNIDLPLTGIADFASLGEKDPMFKTLSETVERNNGLWCREAEEFLLENSRAI